MSELEKQLVTTLKMRPMVEGVAAPMVTKLLDEQKNFPAERIDHRLGENIAR